jgi:hypothetical protein
MDGQWRPTFGCDDKGCWRIWPRTSYAHAIVGVPCAVDLQPQGRLQTCVNKFSRSALNNIPQLTGPVPVVLYLLQLLQFREIQRYVAGPTSASATKNTVTSIEDFIKNYTPDENDQTLRRRLDDW